MKDENLNSPTPDSSFILHPASLFVLRSGAIGDFILTLPALHALRQKFPTHQFILAARGDVLPLVQGTLADEVIPFDSPLLTPLFTPDAQLTNQLTNLVSTVDLAVLWLPENAARIVANNLRRLDVARLIAANPMPTVRHVADHLLDTLVPLGMNPVHEPIVNDLAPFIEVDAQLSESFWSVNDIDTERLIAMHIGSGGAHKRWPFEKFMMLAQQLSQIPDVRLIMISGPAEQYLVRQLENIPPSVIHLAFPKLSSLAAILVHCALYVGNDSGITHLAAALGTPTIALFGPTDPNIWGPRGVHVNIVQSPSKRMEDLTLERVWQVVQETFC